MDNKQFLKQHPLGLHFYGEEIEQVRAILEDSGTKYVLKITEEYHKENDSVTFTVHCPTTTFAQAYYWIGAEIGKKVLAKRKDK